MAKVAELADRQRIFVREYAGCLNATKAALAAGYSKKTAYAIGSRLKSDPRIRKAIDAELEGRSMSRAEVKARIEDIAAGDMEDFLTIDGDEDGALIDINLGKGRAAGKTRLIKKIEITKRTLPGDAGGTETKVKLELYPADAALYKLGLHHGLLQRAENEDDEDGEDGLSDDDIAAELV